MVVLKCQTVGSLSKPDLYLVWFIVDGFLELPEARWLVMQVNFLTCLLQQHVECSLIKYSLKGFHDVR